MGALGPGKQKTGRARGGEPGPDGLSFWLGGRVAGDLRQPESCRALPLLKSYRPSLRRSTAGGQQPPVDRHQHEGVPMHWMHSFGMPASQGLSGRSPGRPGRPRPQPAHLRPAAPPPPSPAAPVPPAAARAAHLFLEGSDLIHADPASACRAGAISAASPRGAARAATCSAVNPAARGTEAGGGAGVNPSRRISSRAVGGLWMKRGAVGRLVLAPLPEGAATVMSVGSNGVKRGQERRAPMGAEGFRSRRMQQARPRDRRLG